MDNIKEVVSKTGRYFHLFIMTSRSNNDETVAFYEKNNFFGYPRDMVHLCAATALFENGCADKRRVADFL